MRTRDLVTVCLLALCCALLPYHALQAWTGGGWQSNPTNVTSGGTTPTNINFTALPSWTVPQWFVDPANSSGCASDGNLTCTISTCGTPGDGPCRTRAQITSRWTTEAPVIAQNTNVRWLSSEASVTADPYRIMVRPVNGATYSETGFLSSVATFALGTVTAKNRSTGQRLTAGGFVAGGLAAGQLVINTTRANSKAWIVSIAGGVATLTQPVAATATTPGSGLYTPAEVDTWVATDTVVVDKLQTVNLRGFIPMGGADLGALGTAGTVWLQDLHINDAGGAATDSYWPATCDLSPYCEIAECVFDPNVIARRAFLVNNFANGQGANFETVTLAGLMGFATTTNAFYDQDVQLAGGLEGHAFNAVGLAYVPTGSVFYTVGRGGWNFTQTYGSGYALWGPGSLAISDGGGFYNTGGSTFATTLLISGGISLDSVATGTKYAAGVWTDAVALTAANLDTNTALIRPQTGSVIGIGH